MAHADRGTKRRCPSCGAPFYDLNRDPAICPKCQTEYVAVARAPLRPTRGQAKAAVVAIPEDAAVFEEDEVLDSDDEHEDEEEGIDGETPDEGDEMRD